MITKLLVLILISSSSFVKASFFPKDTSDLPRTKSRSTVNLDSRLQAVDYFLLQMSSLAYEKGAKLNITYQLDNQKVNAIAEREKNDWNIVVYGGLLRHPDIGETELLLILCQKIYAGFFKLR